MKKCLKLLGVFLFLFLFVIPVWAEEYKLNELIPVNTSATVHTDKFDYNDFVFSTEVNEKGNGKITFGSIQNKTKSKTAVSINIFLFDEDKKNVGYVTYCSDKDYTTESNRGFKLNGGESHPFTIEVSSKFFVPKKELKDVFYIAVEDENPYCHVGGYDQYEGKTLEEIQGTHVPEKESPLTIFMVNLFKNNAMMMLILSALISLTVYFIICSILNNLHRKMYGKRTILCYIPIVNNYIGVKLAFGKIIALIFIIFYLISGVVSVLGVTMLAFVITGLWSIAFIVDIIKLITKNYDLFIFEPSMNNQYEEPLDGPGSEKSEPTLDLSYDNKDLSNDGVNNFDLSTGGDPFAVNKEENKEETDLTKLFH